LCQFPIFAETGAVSGCSPQSYRWQWRKHQEAMVEANAVAFIRGKLMVHPQRFASVIEKQAFSAVRTRTQRRP
jgi:hypothetical protein